MRRQELLQEATEGYPEAEFDVWLRGEVVDRALKDLELSSLKNEERTDAADFLLAPGRLEAWMAPLDVERFIEMTRSEALARLRTVRLEHRSRPLGRWAAEVLSAVEEAYAA